MYKLFWGWGHSSSPVKFNDINPSYKRQTQKTCSPQTFSDDTAEGDLQDLLYLATRGISNMTQRPHERIPIN